MQDEQCRGCGTTDGMFRDERYFACDDKCGLFVALNKLSMDREGNTLEMPPRGDQSCTKAVSHGTATSGQSYLLVSGPPAVNTWARSEAITKRPTVHDDPPPRFKKGDRVVAFDRKGNCIHGTVRWVGKNKAAQNAQNSHWIFGIETVSSSHIIVIVASF